jgi:ElaB/YqjD/DUF883 family membrane-anchored ribosome-binding protein
MHTALTDRAEDALKASAAAAARGIDHAGADLQSRLRHLRRELDDLEDRAAYGSRRVLRATDLSVRTHPYQAIGVALAAGLFTGWLISRR